MRYGIVEGEPGMFPAPVAKVLVKLNRWVRRVAEPRPEPSPEAAVKEPPPAATSDEEP